MAQQATSAKKSTTAKKPKATASKAAASKSAKLEALAPGSDDRMRMIAEAAYLKAEQRGFEGDQAMEDWLQAEAEVDAQFSSRH